MRIVGFVILIAGMIAAALIFATTPPEPDDDEAWAAAPPQQYTKQYQRETEVIGGKAIAVAGGIVQWLEGLGHGRLLAITVGVLSSIVATVFFWLGAKESGRDWHDEDNGPPP